jgi:acetyl esterase/lipase
MARTPTSESGARPAHPAARAALGEAPWARAALTLLAALVILGAALAACGGTTGGASTDGASAGGASPGDPQVGAVYRDLAYGKASAAQRLDLYLPPESTSPYPVVIAIHGGGWVGGDKADGQIEPVLEALKRGYAVAGIDYRLSQEATFPAAISDVKAAIRWLRAHAGEYRLDPDRFAAWGQSAGGNLAALAGTSGGVGALAGPDSTNAEQSDRVQAVIDWYGPISFLHTDQDFRAAGFKDPGAEDAGSFLSLYLGAPLGEVPGKVRAADPITYITPDDPPVLVEHGTADATVPVGQSRRFARALTRVLGPDMVTLRVFPGAGHVDALFFAPEHVDEMLDWLDAQLK